MKNYTLLKTFKVSEAMAKAIAEYNLKISNICRKAVMKEIIKALKDGKKKGA
jgi:hypothetical protein